MQEAADHTLKSWIKTRPEGPRQILYMYPVWLVKPHLARPYERLAIGITILADWVPDMMQAILCISPINMETNIREVLSDNIIQDVYPRIRAEFVLALWETLGPQTTARIFQRFAHKPYDYRAGWPDLTILSEGSVRFIEVKTTDHLHPSQLRFAREVAAPLHLSCSVVRVLPAKS